MEPGAHKSIKRLPQQQKPESFAQRIISGKLKVDANDQHAIANMMLFELNMIAGRLLILQFQLIEVIKAAPRFVSEYLQLEYAQKMRDIYTNLIFRSVTASKNFALLPNEQDID